jgi:hypothetical protein
MTTLCATAVEATPSPVEGATLAVRVCEHAQPQIAGWPGVEGVELHLRSRVGELRAGHAQGAQARERAAGYRGDQDRRRRAGAGRAGVRLSTTSRQHDYRQQADQLLHFRSFVCE